MRKVFLTKAQLRQRLRLIKGVLLAVSLLTVGLVLVLQLRVLWSGEGPYDCFFNGPPTFTCGAGGVALYLLLVVFLIAVLAWRRYTGLMKRYPPGVCECCAYNLTGNISGVCPECGTPIRGSQHLTRRQIQTELRAARSPQTARTLEKRMRMSRSLLLVIAVLTVASCAVGLAYFYAYGNSAILEDRRFYAGTSVIYALFMLTWWAYRHYTQTIKACADGFCVTCGHVLAEDDVDTCPSCGTRIPEVVKEALKQKKDAKTA